ncbi:MAG TPA: hypothetical protein VG407_11135 [Caulobacteraceae bacterium]|jgi:hypothetical protein|nr:hypothetical protein [Caulobacteraceae bacterium]
MAGRPISRFAPLSRFALAAFAASALLGACVKHVDEQAAVAPPPPPPEQPALMGAPADTTAASATDVAATQTQANDDAYVSSLPPGLMAVHKVDAATGRTILVISNYPVANPAMRARIWHARHHPLLNGGPNKNAPSITTASNSSSVTQEVVITATKPSTLTTMAQAAPAPAAATPTTHSAPATQTAGFKGVTLSPGMWLIGGLALLAVVILVMLAGRKQRREPIRA